MCHLQTLYKKTTYFLIFIEVPVNGDDGLQGGNSDLEKTPISHKGHYERVLRQDPVL